MGHNASLGDIGRGFGHMATSNESCLKAKVFHFHVKDSVATDFLIANRVWVRRVKDLESDAKLLQFFGDGVSPKGVTIFTAKVNGFFHGLWYGNAKFVGPVQIAGLVLLGHSNNLFTIFKDVWHPSIEYRLVSIDHGHSIFGNLDGEGLFQVSKWFPRSRAIPPSSWYVYVQWSGCASLFVGQECHFVVNKSVQEIVLVAIRVALQVHALSNEIGGQVSHLSVVKPHLVKS